jgi:hypothetical protein
MKVGSFPVLNSIYPISYINDLSKKKTKHYPPIIKYKPTKKTLIFSWYLYKADITMTKNIEDEGYYITAVARKKGK